MIPEAPAELSKALEKRYRIESTLGQGGMATVYAARDLKHDREVALKVLNEELVAGGSAQRFLTEIKTTARLQHPHILPLYDSGQAGNHLFYVMPLVAGETLRDRMTREQRLPVKEAVRLASEVADALAYAHSHGVVHRDIKPENIMLASDHALVMDFGIARAFTVAASERLTEVGTRVGTALYMSPEQAAGDEEIDGRSDVYSLACVLYEMLAGEPPFTGGSAAAIIAQRFMQDAPSVSAKRPQVPYRIDAALRTAMEREPRDRYQSAARFTDALSGGQEDVGEGNGEAARKSIAVLPFANMSADADAEFFSDGIAEEILNALVRLPGLRVIARTSSFAFKGQNTDIREIGKRLGAGMVLEGSVRRAGNRVRITAQLIDAVGGHHLWSERYDREMQDIFAVQDEITAAIRDALSEKVLGLGSAVAQKRPAIDAETYELFLRGRFFLNKRPEGMQKGMELLGEVLARAPQYAPAYTELATAYTILALFGAVPPQVASPKIRELAGAALMLDPENARAHAELGSAAFWFEWNWPEAQKHYERALALDPNESWSNVALGHFMSSLGRHRAAIAQCQRGRALDPLNPAVNLSLAISYHLARRCEEAIAVCDRILEQDATFSEAYRIKGAALRDLGRLEEAAAPTEAAARFSGGHPWAIALGGMLHGAAGRTAAAEAVAQGLITHHQAQTAPPFIPSLAIALIFCQMRDADRYAEWMERSLAAREPWLVMLRADPSFDPVRDDARHAQLIARVGIPEWQPEAITDPGLAADPSAAAAPPASGL